MLLFRLLSDIAGMSKRWPQETTKAICAGSRPRYIPQCTQHCHFSSRYRFHSKQHHTSHSPSSVKQQPNHPEPPTRIRKISHAFDPVDNSLDNQSRNLFSFLNPTNIAKLPELQHVNPTTPSTMRVPWPTSFPNSLQSKYWQDAEITAREFVTKIVPHQADKRNNQKYIGTVVDSAVDFAINVFPTASLARMKILAKVYVLAFMHDDAVDSGNCNAAIPSRDQVIQGSTSEYLGFETTSHEILSEDDVQGKRLIDGLLFWGSSTQRTHPKTFPTLEEYMIRRVDDVGIYPIFSTVQFASEVYLSDTDIHTLRRMTWLCARHFLLTNDLYSYAKEALTEKTSGESLLNAVRVVQDLMCVTDSSAKSILRRVIWDIERQIDAEYQRFLNTENTTTAQQVYARGLIAAIAGNMFFSATCARYARVIEGSRLR